MKILNFALDKEDNISLDARSVVYVVGELQNYCLIDAERDIIADAFETFIDHALKGGQGQFFTPRNVVRMMVDILDPTDEDYVIDPSCGSGGFLVETLRHIWAKLDAEGEKYHWNQANLREEKMEVALNKLCGIDKDYFLSKVAKAYMAILGDGKSGIFCEDSLENPKLRDFFINFPKWLLSFCGQVMPIIRSFILVENGQNLPVKRSSIITIGHGCVIFMPT